METSIVEFDGKGVKASILVEASPTPGAAGIIANSFLVEALGAKRIGEVTSPHFPQVSIINEQGIASRPKVDLHFAEVEKKRLLFFSRTFPVESNEGSYLLAKETYDYLSRKGIEEYYVLASGRITGTNAVFVSSNKSEHIQIFLSAGAQPTPSLDSIPVDRLTGFLMLMFVRDGKKVCMLLSDTATYFPDPMAAKRLLKVLLKGLNLDLDLSKLDTEIEKQRRMMEEAERGMMELGGDLRDERSSKEPFYIG